MDMSIIRDYVNKVMNERNLWRSCINRPSPNQTK